ncbi:MAG: phage/plasmid primase, P4 family, partial [Methanoregulaceae archaeon]|nr:phage/plasmid primase, P4 family [Methanoregulaceae archaeon]
DDNGGAFRRAEEVVVELYRFAAEAEDSGKRELRSSWARRCDGMAGYRELLEISKNKHPITATIDLFDQDPWLFTCQNATLDLQSGVVKEPNPGHFITKTAKVTYDEAAESPLWNAFLKDIFRDNLGEVDKDLISFVQMAIGYSLTGSMAEQIFFFCFGGGANGKSVFLSVIREMMGDYARQTDFNTFLVQRNESVRNDVAALAGARFITAQESEEGKRLAMALIKSWTGGDPITARFLHHEYFTFNPVGKLWFASNTKPVITERNKGAWRRVCMIPFTVSIPPEMQDPDLEDKLLLELPGIFNWALDGLKKYLEVGRLEVPSSVKNATNLYKEEYDSIGSFIQSRLDFNPDAYIMGKELYVAYNDFCEEAGYTPVSKKKFNQEIGSEPGVMKVDSRHSIKWLGVELLGETIDTVSNVSYVSRNLGFSYVKEIIAKNLEMDSHHSQTHKSNENETVGGGELPPLDQLLATYARKGEPIRTRDYPDIDELEMLEALDAGGWTEKRGVWWPPSEEKR